MVYFIAYSTLISLNFQLHALIVFVQAFMNVSSHEFLSFQIKNYFLASNLPSADRLVNKQHILCQCAA